MINQAQGFEDGPMGDLIGTGLTRNESHMARLPHDLGDRVLSTTSINLESWPDD